MRSSHKTKNTSLFNLLIASGVTPARIKALLELSLETEHAVLYANFHKIPDDIFYEKKRTMIEARTLILMLSED